MNGDPAKSRFFLLQILRWIGIAMVMIGLAILNGALPGLPQAAGYGLLGGGLFDALFLPTLLARRWKSPPR